MKNFCAAVGFTALMMAGTAGAVPIPGPGTPIFSSYTGVEPDESGTFGVRPGGGGQSGGPLSQQFVMGAPGTLTDVILRLTDINPNDGGSILVYLVPDGGANQPAHTGTTLNGKILLGTILDSALPTGATINNCQFGVGTLRKNQCNTSVLTNVYVPTAGTYWISLVDGTDVNNGGSEGRISGAEWWRSGTQVGSQNGVGMFNSHVNIAGNLTSTNLDSLGNFEVQINTPEPASLALLGAGLFGLGLVRRRSRKSAA